MELLYTNENRFLVNNIKNIAENSGIEVTLKNEYASGGMGGLSPFDTWLELWVVDDPDYGKAVREIASSRSPENSRKWICNNCNESNDASFEFYWKCGR